MIVDGSWSIENNMILEHKDRINIKDLVIEEPEKSEYGFKIEDYVTEEDWQILKKEFFRMRKEKVPNWVSRSVHLVSNMLIVFPQKKNELNLDAEFKKSLLERTAEGIASRDDFFLDYFASAVFLYGQDEEIKHLKKAANRASLRVLKRSRAFATNLGQARNFKIVYSGKDVEAMPKNFSVSSLQRQIDENFLDNAVGLASDLKIAYPTTFDQLKINRSLFDDEIERFDKMHEGRLRVGRRRRKQTLNIVDLISTLADLKILAAKEIRFNDCGFELVMGNENIASEVIPALPEVKRYGN